MVPPTSKPDDKYFGIAETEFPLKSYANSTELSKYIWKWKDKKIMLYIKRNIMPIVHGFPKDGVCKLYLTEKFLLSKHFNDRHLLNKKSEFLSK